MSAYLIESDGRSLAEVQRLLQKYLPSVDVRLFPLSARRAVLRGHLLEALTREYSAPREQWLKVLGIAHMQALRDEDAVGALQGRDPVELPRRATQTQPDAALDWHLRAVNVEPAWQLLGGPDQIDWQSTKVAHLDTGYTEHPAFGFPGASWIDQTHADTDVPLPPNGNPHFQPPEPGGGRDTVQGLFGGHGTRVGATLCGWHPQAPQRPYLGVAPRVPYLPMRITDSVWINHAQRQLARTMRQAIDSGGAQIVNISLGVFAGQVLREMRSVLDHAYERGVIVVCAAGNIVDDVVAPARLRRSVAVAGVTIDERPWSGSAFGPTVDFSAPAADLRRADVNRKFQFGYKGGGDGTSYAAAITSGAAALWLTYRRAELAQRYPLPWCRVAAFVRLARQTARVPTGGVWQVNSGFGAGILDIGALLAEPLPDLADLSREAEA
jgi:subtilisin family serine protease